MIIDRGVPVRYFADFVESYGEHFDFMKFGWGTSVVTKDFTSKLDAPSRRERRLLSRWHAV